MAGVSPAISDKIDIPDQGLLAVCESASASAKNASIDAESM